MIFGSLPGPAKVLLGIRVLNQVGTFAFAFLAVLAGPHLVTAALTVFGVAALVSRWAGGVLLDRAPPRTLMVLGLAATGVPLSPRRCPTGRQRSPWKMMARVLR